MLLLREDLDVARLETRDGKRINFYTMIPLYAEEKDLEEEKGTVHLLRLFEKHGIGQVVDLRRPNVARPRRRTR